MQDKLELLRAVEEQRLEQQRRQLLAKLPTRAAPIIRPPAKAHSQRNSQKLSRPRGQAFAWSTSPVLLRLLCKCFTVIPVLPLCRRPIIGGSIHGSSRRSRL